MVEWQITHRIKQELACFDPSGSSMQLQRLSTTMRSSLRERSRIPRQSSSTISSTAGTKRQCTWKHVKARRSQLRSVLNKPQKSWKEKTKQRQESRRTTSNLWPEEKSLRTTYSWKNTVYQEERQSKWQQSYWEERNTKVSARSQWTPKETKKRKESEPYIGVGDSWRWKATDGSWRRNRGDKKVDVGCDEGSTK